MIVITCLTCGRYVCSDGGDSLLDSDCEEEREKSSTQPSQSVIRSHSPHNVPQVAMFGSIVSVIINSS